MQPVRLSAPREASPIVALAGLNAVLVLLAAVDTGAWTLGTAAELLTCIAAGMVVIFPVSASFVACLLLTLGVWFADGPGIGAFAPLLCVVMLSIDRRPYAVACFGVWIWGDLAWWTSRTLRANESLLQYMIFWGLMVAGADLAGRIVRAYVTRSRKATQASLSAQRQGIARDLHDTVAHSLSLIMMRAEQSRLRGRAEPDDLAFITQTAERSIRELRGMMSLLREQDSGAADEIWLVPRLDEALIEAEARLTDHGFTPAISSEGDIGALPTSVDATLSKLVHEGANNIIKHAADRSHCAIMIEVTDNEAELVITNVPRRTPLVRSGHDPLGLACMRERVTALGGEFCAGLGAARWITRARLPLT